MSVGVGELPVVIHKVCVVKRVLQSGIAKETES